jgi:protoheme IX farnesyltransferase
MTNTDYARANIPMLPNVRGVAHTKIEIFVYSLLLVAASLALTPLRVFGLWYFVPALGLGAFFLWDAWKLLRGGPVKPAARALFKYSLLYLALMCAAMVLDSVVR